MPEGGYTGRGGRHHRFRACSYAVAIQVGQAFEPAGEGDFPAAWSRGWKAPLTGSLERLPYVGYCFVAAACISSSIWRRER